MKQYFDWTGHQTNELLVLGEHKDYPQQRNFAWDCKCMLCGKKKVVTTKSLLLGTVSCGCERSRYERAISNWLTSHGVSFRRERTLEGCVSDLNRPLRFDFSIMDKKTNRFVCLIEYQHIQHDPVLNMKYGERQRETDIMKKNFCNEHDIPLYEIWYYQDMFARLQEILDTVHVDTVPSAS